MTPAFSHQVDRRTPYRPLGTTDVQVSALCLGTQTFGAQTSETDAHAQLDLAFAHGVNFVDTAEMYPFPPDATTAGATETIVGNWLRTRRRRHDVVVATKVTSRSAMTWIGDGTPRLTRARIEAAVDGSLRRLQTDHIDLYQLHWPDRYTNFFGRLGYAPDAEADFIPLEDQLAVLHDLVTAGKVRHVGVSNETAWGVMTFIRLAETRGWPRVVSIQNPYSLLNRSFEVGLAEVAIRERCGLLAYSPLGFGLLTGKYATSTGGRLAQFPHASRRYTAPRSAAAADAYVRIALEHGLDPAQMALAFATSRPFVTSTIIGATTAEQLATNIASLDVTLSAEVLHDIETAHDADRYPCPLRSEESTMAREVLQNVNLLKKYHHTTVYDYTEYPTKAFWSEDMKDQAYRDALADWIPRSNGAPVLFYVHTPFCEELCYFCLCSKEITKEYSRVTDYLYQQLFREIDLLGEHFERHALRPNVEEIYFGGGSPTYYREPEFEALLGKLRTVIDFDRVKTFTVEVDPRRVDVDRLRFYHAMGVNRLSFGIQDFDPEVQKEINRNQPPEIVAALLTPEYRSYFPTINFDLLIGLPKQTPQSIRRTIESVVALAPDQIQTMYVHYKPQVRKYMVRMVQNGPMPDFYDRKAIFVEATEGLMAAGYERAGFESFAKPGDVLASSMGREKAYYNSLGTTTGDATNFISVGSSAHGVLGGEYYFQNYYEQEKYREALAKGEFPIYRGYKLTPEDKLRADVIKRLRTYFRIDVDAIEDRWEIDFRRHFANELSTLQEFERDALVQFDADGVALTDLGRHFAPQVASVFDSFLDRPPFNPDVVVHGA